MFSSTGFIANVLGYVTLANLLGNSLIGGSYLAVVLYAVVAVLDGLARIALSVRPLTALGTVSRHRSLLHHRVRRVFEALAIAAWIVAVLQLLLLREPLVDSARSLLTVELNVGALHISLGEVVAFRDYYVRRLSHFAIRTVHSRRGHLPARTCQARPRLRDLEYATLSDPLGRIFFWQSRRWAST